MKATQARLIAESKMTDGIEGILESIKKSAEDFCFSFSMRYYNDDIREVCEKLKGLGYQVSFDRLTYELEIKW